MEKIVKNKMWKVISDSDHNPLQRLPMGVRYQVMTILAIMWSLIFCMMVHIQEVIPYWILGHVVLVTVGCVITNYTFDNYKPTHRDLFKSQSGTYALYDDYWGS